MNRRVAFLGNHIPPFSTESELGWTFEQMGWDVITLQENTVTTDKVMEAVNSADLFLYVHTHGWNTRGTTSMDEVIKRLNDTGIPTASFHLDRYWGLNGDHRQDLIGKHPFWKCKYVFTADGGNQEKFAERGISHYWLPPGIASRHCFVGNKRPEFLCDVAYVGARGYHSEWPFRERLVSWLDQPHGWTVKRWGGDRPGTRSYLNDIYASAKIVVGDSCFAGSPRYWSDRVPETVGRCGFLIHPKSEGMTIPLAHYIPQSLEDLGKTVEYFLSHDNERIQLQQKGFEHVKQHDTYTLRVEEMLRVMGLTNA